MKVQFVFNNDIWQPIEIEVAEKLTAKQAADIENYIFDKMEKWEEETGDMSEFDFYECCCNAVKKYAKLATNEVIKTFYF